MNKRFIALMIVLWIIMVFIGARKSHVSGIQPGYFEKAEAPAYGVGGEERIGAGLDEKQQKHFEQLYEEEDEEE